MKGDVAMVRKAALALARMAPSDRTWTMDNLPPERRALISRELMGLKALGINVEVLASSDLVGSMSSRSPVPAVTADSVESNVNFINGLNSSEIREMLSTWPTKLRFAFANAATWSWIDPTLESLPGSSSKLTPRASQALVEAAAAVLRNPA